jgi:hypothetical protein
VADVPVLETVLLCDDVRREVTGKDIIIGVFGEELTTAQMPLMLMINLYMRVRFPKPNTNYQIEFRVIGPSEVPLTPAVKSMLRSADEKSPQISTVSLGGIPLQVQSPGLIQFQWKTKGSEDWSTIARLEVKQGAVREVPGMIFNPATNA